ncbi:GHMP family kinase ATP-binding protein [Rhodopirellula bahusiensis]|nr:beta-ribofuranosylaminobenzene 5'-phosphate synthase [Rhodopirellula bahusiensis]
MIDGPTTCIRVRAASTFECDRRHRDRIVGIVDRWRQMTGDESHPSVSIEVVEAAPSHNGLGSGTQLSLGIAFGLLKHTTGETPNREHVLQLANRGRRSAVGSHGFFEPGLIVEGLDRTRSNDCDLNPIDHLIQIPDSWRVGVVLMDEDSAAETISGDEEQQQFDALQPATHDVRSRLVRILTDELVPAVQRSEFNVFADALTRYNRSSGELFASVQGGPYNGEATADLIERMIVSGHRGVGQSSWGPGVFTWFDSEQAARRAAQSWNERFPGTRLRVQRPLRHPCPR